jgi:hypothetical protein
LESLKPEPTIPKKIKTRANGAKALFVLLLWRNNLVMVACFEPSCRDGEEGTSLPAEEGTQQVPTS